ncbi:hypothetical protein G6F57_011724 [Rhizopus arrhizus]|nr:hypothetical protein G6F24_011708 [Rhizopus arrhizus]KAG1391779.1 hypothetical protein G6F58_012642 [Rhizopus delemar]KAG0923333.1 hypothetical protein G6F30_013895 [Rhizopus arrhizus]KAG0979620.1 hypothetical protein G6F29_008449 [Rhizopus arrhizus]KAG0981325.1 hypothetical protein G6F28_011448 [Rhizopus arrhizus]
MNITRDQAICRFLCEDYSKENAARLSKKIEELGTFDVCYENDPKRPVLLNLANVRSQPSIFKFYETSNEEACNGKMMPFSSSTK